MKLRSGKVTSKKPTRVTAAPTLTAEQKYAELEKKYADLQKKYDEMDEQFRKKFIECASHERMHLLVRQLHDKAACELQILRIENAEMKEELENIEHTKMYQH